VVCLVSSGSFLLQSEFEEKANNDFSFNNSIATKNLSEKDIAHLPMLVQNYIRYTKSIGKPKINNFRAELKGEMWSNAEDSPMEVQSVQYNFFKNPSRYFYMTASKMGLPATGLHLYQNQTATFQVNLLNWIKVVDAHGDKMNQAETVTLLNDMCIMAPASLIDKRISWVEVDETKVKAFFKNGKIIVSAILYFNETGELVNFRSDDRYETDGVKYEKYPWSTPLENYKEFNGYLLPSSGKLIFHKPEGDFLYGILEITSIDYNLEKLQ
jgi:hypothetical protein